MIPVLVDGLHCHCWGGGPPLASRVTPPVEFIGCGTQDGRGSVRGENLPTPDRTTSPTGVYLPSVGSQPSADGDLSIDGSETSSSVEKGPVPAIGARTVEHQLESRLLCSRVGGELG